MQPLISSVTTSRDVWERLNSSFTSASRSRIISLKSKLVKNPKGNRRVAEYLQDMHFMADDIALAQSPIVEEDLLVHILSQLGDDYNTIVAAIKVRENPLSYLERFDKFSDFERALKDATPNYEPTLLTANYTTRQQGRQHYQYPLETFGSQRWGTQQQRNKSLILDNISTTWRPEKLQQRFLPIL